MLSFKHLVASTAIVALAITQSFAVTSVRKLNLLHNNARSPFFVKSADDANTFLQFEGSDAIFAPAAPRAGEVSTLTTNGAFNIVGNSTSAGGWNNGNGVPAGITLTFNASITFSVNPASPAGSYLTLVSNTGNRGNGLGITQNFHGTSTVDSINQNEIVNGTPGDADELLDVSAVTVSNISFTGTLAEAGFDFTPGSVGNFGPYVIRSGDNTASGMVESAETFGLISETGPPPQPGDEGLPTIGFGRPIIQSEIDLRRGEGIVASHVSSTNDFAEVPENGDSNHFLRQIGAWTLDPQNGTMGIKGIGYEYDVTFDITTSGDFNHDDTVDAADYVVWRKGVGTEFEEVDYEEWVENFGQTYPSGGAGGSVPEPATLTLLIFGLAAIGSRRFLR